MTTKKLGELLFQDIYYTIKKMLDKVDFGTIMNLMPFIIGLIIGFVQFRKDDKK